MREGIPARTGRMQHCVLKSTGKLSELERLNDWSWQG